MTRIRVPVTEEMDRLRREVADLNERLTASGNRMRLLMDQLAQCERQRNDATMSAVHYQGLAMGTNPEGLAGYETLLDDRRRLQEAVARYGRHLPGCELQGPTHNDPSTCLCGFAQLQGSFPL